MGSGDLAGQVSKLTAGGQQGYEGKWKGPKAQKG